MVKNKDYIVDGIAYHCRVSRRRIRRIYVTMPNDDNEFEVRVPYLTMDFTIDKAVADLLPGLLRRKANYMARKSILPYGEDYTYILGEKVPVKFEDKNQFLKYAKKNVLPQIEERFLAYENRMGIQKPYKLILRDMSTRYGVNSSRTHRITLSLILVHYPLEVVDAIIVHELAHDFQRNHSQKFYDIVFKYCPDYKRLHAKLKQHDYENDHLQS